LSVAGGGGEGGVAGSGTAGLSGAAGFAGQAGGGGAAGGVGGNGGAGGSGNQGGVSGRGMGGGSGGAAGSMAGVGGSSGTAGLGGSSGAGGSVIACTAAGQRCTSDDACCSKSCNSFLGHICCVVQDHTATCVNSSDCCGFSNGAKCQNKYCCWPAGGGCLVAMGDVQCCSGRCIQGATPGYGSCQ
jgi:hypothetical protein